MKNLLALLFLLLFGCAPVRELLSPEELSTYDELVVTEARLKAEIESATDPATKLELEAKLDETQRDIARIEIGAIRRSYGPMWSALYGLPVVGPVAQSLGPLLLPLLLPFASPRGRKHYLAMLRELTPGVTGKAGGRGINPVEGLRDMGRAFGMLHSNEASAKAAEA